MFCTNCGKTVEPDTKFCPKCGARQTEKPSSAAPVPPTPPPAVAASPVMAVPQSRSPVPARTGKLAAWAAVVTLVVAILGGVGYWGWNNKVARDEAAQKLASDEATRKIADAEQRRVAAEKAADAAEIKAAQLLLAKHIAAEEAEAQAQRP